MPDCNNCTEKCPQAEMAHEIALGRMYVTQEFLALIKKMETGELVEVVRCKDCRWGSHWKNFLKVEGFKCNLFCADVNPDGFCSYGERRTDETD